VPYKHAEGPRHKFNKPKYKVTNWPEYNDALRKHGDWGLAGVSAVFVEPRLQFLNLFRLLFKHRPQKPNQVVFLAVAKFAQVGKFLH
jgi:hypothetical protein